MCVRSSLEPHHSGMAKHSAHDEGAGSDCLTTAERREAQALRRKNRALREEREIQAILYRATVRPI